MYATLLQLSPVLRLVEHAGISGGRKVRNKALLQSV
jgi:hypothetical protein